MPAEMRYHVRYRYHIRYHDSDDGADSDSLRMWPLCSRGHPLGFGRLRGSILGGPVHAQRGEALGHVMQRGRVMTGQRAGVRLRHLADKAIHVPADSRDTVDRPNVAEPHRIEQGPQRDRRLPTSLGRCGPHRAPP